MAAQRVSGSATLKFLGQVVHEITRGDTTATHRCVAYAHVRKGVKALRQPAVVPGVSRQPGERLRPHCVHDSGALRNQRDGRRCRLPAFCQDPDNTFTSVEQTRAVRGRVDGTIPVGSCYGRVSHAALPPSGDLREEVYLGSRGDVAGHVDVCPRRKPKHHVE
jgi:hypothetical protein